MQTRLISYRNAALQGCHLILAALLTTLCTSACTPDAAETLSQQRRAGETRLDDGSRIQLTAGAFPSTAPGDLVIRSAAPVLRFRHQTSPDFSGPLQIDIRNTHVDAVVRVASISGLTDEAINGCPRSQELVVSCEEANAAVGEACGEACPDGTQCEAGVCEATPELVSCQRPPTERYAEDPTRFSVQLDGRPCRDIQYLVELPEDAAARPLRYVVIGSTDDLATFRTLQSRLEDVTLDFAVLLGDHVTVDELDGLEEVEEELAAFGVPIVYVAGEDEIEIGDGPSFLERAGPYDFTWVLKRVRFATFFSADGTLSDGAVERLDRTLGELERRGSRLGDGPFVTFTHVPPLDPKGFRGQGFDNELEGAQTLSVLRERGVDVLFAGHLAASDSAEIDGLELVVTTAQDTALDDEREVKLVTIDDADSDIGGSVIGDRRMRIETRDLR